jgi:SAM-dependent methyltransferase
MGHLIPFTCNICGQPGRALADRFDREISACPCGSTVRVRSAVHWLSVALFGRSIPLPEFPHDPSITGIGLSDWSGYADALAERLGYRNTWFHIEPRVDITAPPEGLLGSLDFLISSDVFEHVPPPVDRAFQGAAALLKPGGWLVLTVPYKLTAETAEHYPEMQDFAVAELGGRRCVVVLNRNGSLMLDPEPVFHGGAGVTLEMRMLSENDVLAHLASAGFEDVQIKCEDVPEWGIYHKRDFELPILARKGIGAPGKR